MSENWKLHDLVEVKHQPKMQNVNLQGFIGIITEIDGDYATIAELQLSGLVGSSGAVELSCLQRPTKLSDPIQAAYAIYRTNFTEHW